jgi:hypothetical protein
MLLLRLMVVAITCYNLFGLINRSYTMASIYEVLIRQNYFDQECLNRIHYVSDEALPVPTAFALAEAIGANSLASAEFDTDSLMGKLQALQNDALIYLEVQVKNLYSATDFFTVAYNPPPNADATGTQGMSPAVSYGVVSNRVTLAVRRGHKRFAGVSEGAVDAGGVLNSGGLTAVTAVADKLSEDAVATIGMATYTYHPAVLAFNKYTTESGKTAYKPYDDADTQLAHAAIGVTYSVMTTVRTQRSRQYGRGI